MNRIKTIILLATVSLIAAISLQGDRLTKVISLQNDIGDIFLDAIEFRDVRTIRKLIEEGFDVNTPIWRDNQGTALMAASYRRYPEIVEILLEAGANVDLQDKHGATALILASFFGHDVVVEILLKAGANVDLQEKHGKTALMEACLSGHIDVAKLLLKAGANVDLQDKNGRTALIRTSSLGYVDCVKLLLKAGANVDLQDNDGRTALMEACDSVWVGVVKLLLEAHANVNLQDKDGCTALMMWATIGNNFEIIKMLMAGPRKPDLQIKNNQGLTALDMIDNGLYSLGVFDKPGKFAELYQAIISNDFNKVNELVPTFFGYWGSRTPDKQLILVMAQTFGTIEMYQYLCEAWNVPSENSWKSTVLDFMECYLNP